MTQHPTPPTQGPQRPGCTCTRHSDTGKSPGAVQGMASRYSVLPHTHNGASPQGPHSAFGRGRGRCPSFITNADTHLGHHRDRQRRRQRRHLLATPRTHREGQKGSMERTRPNKQTGSRAGGGGARAEVTHRTQATQRRERSHHEWVIARSTYPPPLSPSHAGAAPSAETTAVLATGPGGHTTHGEAQRARHAQDDPRGSHCCTASTRAKHAKS